LHPTANFIAREYNSKYKIEVAFFISTFYEASGAIDEKGKEKTPKAGVSLKALGLGIWLRAI